MQEVLLGQPLAKKPKKDRFESGIITFTRAGQYSHNDPLVTQLRIHNYDIKKILVDIGSLVEVMYDDLFKQLNLAKEDLKPTRAPLIWFIA